MIGSVPPPAPRFTVVMPTRGVRVPLPAALASVAAAAAAVGGDVEVVLVHDRRPGDPPLTTAKLAAPAGLAEIECLAHP